jgi:toxin HigB-1
VIRSFKDRRAQQLHRGERVPAFEGFRSQAEKRLRILEAADTLEALRALRSNRLEALKGDRKGRYSIRINDQWRICFVWGDDKAYEVEIVDYH